MSALPPGILVRLPKVIEVTGYSRATVYAHMRAGRFPRPVNTGPHMVAWRSDDINAYLDQLLAGEWKPIDAGSKAALAKRRELIEGK